MQMQKKYIEIIKMACWDPCSVGSVDEDVTSFVLYVYVDLEGEAQPFSNFCRKAVTSSYD
jgi:hypothetical protein